MAHYSNKSFSTYLLNFQENYLFFSTEYAGRNLDLFLSQFVHDQINMAQTIYGDQYAEQTRAFATQLNFYIRKAA